MANSSLEHKGDEPHAFSAAAGATMFWGPWDERRPDEIGDLQELTTCYPLRREQHGKWVSYYMKTTKPDGNVEKFWLVRNPFSKHWEGHYSDTGHPGKPRARRVIH